MRRSSVAWALVPGVLTGCFDNELGIQQRHANRAPETTISSGAGTGCTDGNRVHLYWSGADADGTIDHYDFILMSHAAAGCQDSIADDLVIRFPEIDDRRWVSTFSRDTLIAVRIDSLTGESSPRIGMPLDSLVFWNEWTRSRRLERWHTIFVRAVDNEGLPDPTPDYRSFNARTLAPIVRLRSPVVPRLEFRAPRVVVFHWDGTDPDGIEREQPLAARWALLPSSRNSISHYAGYPDSIYRLPPHRWSPWRPWNASDSTGRQAIVRGLQPVTDGGGGFYLFAVQAMDEAGAVTTVFDADSPGKNNVARVSVTDRIGPTLVLDDRYMGTFRFERGSRPITLEIAAGQPLAFRWRADASGYGGSIDGYRFGWDLRNPEEDDLWEQGWSATSRSAPQRAFERNTHRFYLEARDNAGSVTRAVVELVTYRLSKRLPLLLVDDTIHQLANDEAREDGRWLAVIDSLQRRKPFSFQIARDIYDVREQGEIPPPISKIFEYQSIVWCVVRSTRGSALQQIAMFSDPLLERNHNVPTRFNYLNIYVDNGGALWVCGDQPAHSIWPIPPLLPNNAHLPANIIDWQDFIEPHPERDSVGVNSLLYKLGVEAVDLGAGGRAIARRQTTPHGARGFRSAPAANATGVAPRPDLEPDTSWPPCLPLDCPTINPLGTRPNIEIYNMPQYLATRTPPLWPAPGISLVAYTYASGVAENEPAGLVYPLTADGQPAVLLRKTNVLEPLYTRAICGFEPWRLRLASHIALADYILLQHFHTDSTESATPP